MPSSKKLFLDSTKAALALQLDHVSPADLSGSTSLSSAGLEQTGYAAFSSALHQILSSSKILLPPLDEFSQALELAPNLSLGSIARAARESASVCTCPPPPSLTEPFKCEEWFEESFSCRVRCGIRRWAASGQIPEEGLTGDITLESLQLFTPETCTELMNRIAAQQPYAPFTPAFIGVCTQIEGTTTIRDLEILLYKATFTPCRDLFQP